MSKRKTTGKRTKAAKRVRRAGPSPELLEALRTAFDAGRLSLGLVRTKIPALFDEPNRRAAEAALEALLDDEARPWGRDNALGALLCAVTPSAAELERVRAYLADLPLLAPAPFQEPSRDAPIPNEIRAAERENERVHGPIVAARERARSLIEQLADCVRILEHPRLAIPSDSEVIVNFINRVWRASHLLRPDREHTTYTAMVLVESIKHAVEHSAPGSSSIELARAAYGEFAHVEAPELAHLFEAADFIPAVEAWTERPGPPKMGAPSQWKAIAELVERFGCKLGIGSLEKEWRDWKAETNLEKRLRNHAH